LENPERSNSEISVVGPYRLIAKIGEGGMGIVYRAAHEQTGLAAAVKMVRSPSPKLLSALRDEVAALRRTRHPGVVQVLGEGLSDGLPWYAMELLDGMTLASFNWSLWGDTEAGNRTNTTQSRVDLDASSTRQHLVHHHGTTPPARSLSAKDLQEILSLYRDVCSALGHVHQRGMVHRDLKPSNVFLKAGSGPVLMDFGLASRSGGTTGRETLVSSTSTARAGSAHYMSPEQIRGDVVDARADLYSLGCMLYESLCGHPPFYSPGPVDVLSAQLNQPVTPPSHVVSGIPPTLDTLLEQLLAKTPQQRIGYAEDVDAVLDRLGGSIRPEYASARGPETSYLYRPRLAGRADSLDEVGRHLDGAADGFGTVVLIGGESGIGKTFLATEISRMAVARQFTTVTGDCLAVVSHNGDSESPARATGAPFHPFRRLLQYVGDLCREGGRDVADRLLGDRGKILAQYEPSLAFVPGQDRYPDPSVMLPDAARRRVFEALSQIIVNISDDRPLLWVLDDLQWADDLSLTFLSSYLPSLVTHRRILIVLTFRSDEPVPGLSTLVNDPAIQVINLERLNASTLSTLVADMLGMAAVPEDLITFLSEQSHGNPFFVAEYLRVAVTEDILHRLEGRWEINRLGTNESPIFTERLKLPGSLRGLIGRRFQNLDSVVRSVLDCAAVVGREAEVELIAHVLSGAAITGSRISESLETLRRRQIIEWIDSGRVRFAHDTIREAAYDGVSEPQRRSLHARLAHALELRTIWSAEQSTIYPRLAHHFANAGELERAADYSLRAARLARVAFANDDAIRFYRAAAFTLEKKDDGNALSSEARALLLVAHEELGEILAITGEVERAEKAYSAGLALCANSDMLTRARLCRRLGKACTAKNNYDQAIHRYDMAEAILTVEGPGTTGGAWREWVEIQTDKIWAYYWTGDTAALDLIVNRLAPVVERHATTAQRANFYQAYCLADLRRSRYRVSANTLALIRAAARDAADAASPPDGASVRFIYAFALLLFGLFEDARAELQEVVQMATRLGDPLLKVRALAYLSLTFRYCGTLERTKELALETIDLAALVNAPHYLGTGQATLGWVAYSRGQASDAEHLLRSALSSWAAAPTVYPFQDLALWPLAALLFETGRAQEACRHLDALRDVSQRRFSDDTESALAALAVSNVPDVRSALHRLFMQAKHDSLY
jgi:serine/threonine protein kinase/tetratricopeptide (TPR) repeat protein